MKKSFRKQKCFDPPGRFLTVILAAALGVTLLAGCGAANRYSAGASAPQYMAVAETAAASYDYDAVPAAAAYNYDYKSEYGMDTGQAEYAAEEAADSTALTGSGPITSASAAGRKLIRTVFMNVETDAFDDVVKQLQEKIAELSGYIERSDMSGSSMNEAYSRSNRQANITARIPSASLDQFISIVEGSGNVIFKSEATEDVTLQYSDLESRKKTLTVEQDRIWALLEKADTLEAVIALEERLSEIRYELESMESRLRLYDNQVEYSTIDITINEKTVIEFTPTAPETVGERIRKGFTRNVNGVLEAITDLFIFLVAASPVWIPLAIAVILAVVLVKRSIKKKKTKLFSSIPAPSEEMKPKE